MDSLKSELYFKVADSEFELSMCYRLRYKVYCEEKKWLSTSNYPNQLETDEYDDKAIHVIALNQDFQVVGLMRILQQKVYDQLPYFDHPGLRNNAYRAENSAELSRFVITADCDRYHVLRGLTRAVYQTSRSLGIDNWIFVHEPSLGRLLGMIKFTLKPVCSPTKYYGGLTQVGVINISLVEKQWRSNDLNALRFNKSNMSVMSPQPEFENQYSI